MPSQNDSLSLPLKETETALPRQLDFPIAPLQSSHLPVSLKAPVWNTLVDQNDSSEDDFDHVFSLNQQGLSSQPFNKTNESIQPFNKNVSNESIQPFNKNPPTMHNSFNKNVNNTSSYKNKTVNDTSIHLSKMGKGQQNSQNKRVKLDTTLPQQQPQKRRYPPRKNQKGNTHFEGKKGTCTLPGFPPLSHAVRFPDKNGMFLPPYPKRVCFNH